MAAAASGTRRIGLPFFGRRQNKQEDEEDEEEEEAAPAAAASGTRRIGLPFFGKRQQEVEVEEDEEEEEEEEEEEAPAAPKGRFGGLFSRSRAPQPAADEADDALKAGQAEADSKCASWIYAAS